MNTEWAQVFEAQFGRKLMQSEIAGWDGEFTAAFPDIASAEIIPSIRSVANFWQSNAPVGCKDIIARIRRERGSTPRRRPDQSAQCSLCSRDDGWINFWAWYDGARYPNAPIVEISFGGPPDTTEYVCLKTSMACTCSRGDTLQARTKNGAVDFAYAALRQKVSRLRRDYLGLKAAHMEGVEEVEL